MECEEDKKKQNKEKKKQFKEKRQLAHTQWMLNIPKANESPKDLLNTTAELTDLTSISKSEKTKKSSFRKDSSKKSKKDSDEWRFPMIIVIILISIYNIII